MGSAASLEKVPDVLSKAEVQKLAGPKFRENVYLEVANDDLTMTKTQYAKCVELDRRNLLRYVVVGFRDRNSSSKQRRSPAEWAEVVAAHRDAGNLLEAAVTAQQAFMDHSSADLCIEWLRALHAQGSSAGRLVNLAEGYCSIFPDSAELKEFLVNARKKVIHPFEEVEDQLYVLTEEDRQRVDESLEALHLDSVKGAEVRRHAPHSAWWRFYSPRNVAAAAIAAVASMMMGTDAH